MDVQKRIKELMEDRGWTDYRLCKESGLSALTVANMFNRNILLSRKLWCVPACFLVGI